MKAIIPIMGAACVAAALAGCGNARAAQQPGPDGQQYAAPWYACSNHVYVATTGSDTTGTGSSTAPYATMQHANDVLSGTGSIPTPAPNTCVEVEAGTYTAGVNITTGGNLASSTGYLIYRCVNPSTLAPDLDACTITDVNAGGNNAAFAISGYGRPGNINYANYVVIDGFKITAASSTPYGQGISVTNGLNGVPEATQYSVIAPHHIFVQDNIISGYGQAGIAMDDAEYFFVMHNTVKDNSGGPVTSTQGSGISLYNLHALPSYTRTAADNNMNLYGHIGTAFHNVVGYNIGYNNAVAAQPGHGDTDGNFIILDTLDFTWAVGTSPYVQGTLVDYNVGFNNGGGCVHVFESEDVTVANNTCWNNRLDTNTNSTTLAEIDTAGSFANTIINNIAYSFPNATDATPAICNTFTYPTDGWRNGYIGGGQGNGSNPVTGDTFANNLFQLSAASCRGVAGVFVAPPPADDTDGGYYNYNFDAPNYDANAFTCVTSSGQGELCEVDAMLKNVGTTSMGTISTKPSGINFVILTGSPAIGAGLAETYLPSSSVDIGACASTVQSQCPSLVNMP